MTQMTPQEIVSELDKHIIGQAQAAAKAAVSFAGGEKVDTKIPVDYVKVTKDNAAEILELVK